MPLPHFTNININRGSGKPGDRPDEPVFLNLFEITFVLPVILTQQGRDPIVFLEQANSVSLDLTPAIEYAEQRFKYSTRTFMKTPSKTHVDFNIKFNINVNDKNQVVIWNNLKAWYDLVWNADNGQVGYKADTIGTVIVNQHDKKGFVLRRVTFNAAQIKQIAATELAWSSTEIQSDVQADFVADYWLDEYYDGNVGLQQPVISGY